MSFNLSPLASNHLRLLSGLSAIFVVYIHGTTMKYSVEPKDWESLVMGTQSFLSHNIFHVALPIFFANAAFFLFLRIGTLSQIWLRIGRRATTLIMPYLAWSGFWLVFVTAFEILPERTPKEMLYTWTISPLPGQLWFLRDLIMLVLLAPIFCLLPTALIAIGALASWCWWLGNQTMVTLDLRTQWYEAISNEAISWFLIGLLAVRHSKQTLRMIERGFPQLALLLLALIWIVAPAIPDSSQLGHGLSVTAGTLALFGSAPYLRAAAASRFSVILGAYGFLIYLAHHPALGVTQAWLLQLLGDNQFWHLIVYLFTPTAIIIAIICCFDMVSRFFPLITYAANGGRDLPEIFMKRQSIKD